MPPKKTRSRTGSSQSSQPMHHRTRSISRDPSAEPQRQTRGTRKRRHSTDSDTSEQPTPATTPSKRNKKVKSTAQAEVDHQRLQDVVEDDAEDDDMLETVAGADATHSTEASHVKHVHFGAGDPQDENMLTSDDLEMDKDTATHITPHPRNMSIKRRITISPQGHGGYSESKRIKTTSTRHSLPSALSQDGEGVVAFVKKLEYAPLRELVYEGVQKLERIHQLDLDLSLHRQNNDNGRAQEIEEELAQLREEKKSLDMLVLAHQEEITYPELPSADLTTSRLSVHEPCLSSSQLRTQEDVIKTERETLRDSVMALSREATDARASLQVLEIEVQGLGFGANEDNVASIMHSIRDSFTHVRETLRDVLLEAAPHAASNQDLLDILVTNIKQFANRLHLQDQELLEKSRLTTELGNQVRGLVDHLAEAEWDKSKLKERFEHLDKENDAKERDIKDLQDELYTTSEENDTLHGELHDKTNEAQVLKDENLDFAQSIDRLTSSLQQYREEETRLTKLISTMEEEHRSGVSKMNQEREETVRDLEDRLDEETKLRTEAEQQSSEYHDAIDSLELQKAELESERDDICEQLASMATERDHEQGARESVEAELVERSEEVGELEMRIRKLEDDLEDLDSHLVDLKRLNDAERAQRESAEHELEKRDAEVEEFEQKLLQKGKEANELRQKLFEVQQQNGQQILELQQQALERDEQYQSDIGQEVERREKADELAQQRLDTTLELLTRLDDLEQEMRAELAQRDKRLEALAEQLAQKDGELETLRSDLQNVEDAYDIHIEEAEQQRIDLEGSVAALQDTITKREEQIASLRQEAFAMVENHNSGLEDRNAHIAELNHTVAELETNVTDLSREKGGLERRVEQEAEQMLEYQNEKQDEVESLKATIRDKQEKIQTVEDKAVVADRRWQELLGSRDVDIAMRDEEIQEKTQTITTLQASLQSMKAKIHEYVRTTNSRQGRLRDEAAAYQARLEEDGAELEKDGERVLQDIESLETFEEATVTTTVTHAQQELTRKTRGRKKRVVDSGIGMADSEDDRLSSVWA